MWTRNRLRLTLLLTMQGAKAVPQLCSMLGVGSASVARMARPLKQLGLLRKTATGLQADPGHPVSTAMTAVVFAAGSRPAIPQLICSPLPMRIVHAVSRNPETTRECLILIAGVSRRVVFREVETLVQEGILIASGRRPTRYCVHPRDPIAVSVARLADELAAYDRPEPNPTPDSLIGRAAWDSRLLLALQYGSSLHPERVDALSDVDLALVVHEPASVEAVRDDYGQPGIDVSVFTKTGFLNMLRRQPVFAHTLRNSKALRGADFLRACL